MPTVIIGLASAMIFGAADFFGGLASKRISPVRVTGIASIVGLVLLLVAEPFFAGRWSVDAVLYGGISGLTGAIAIVLLYGCLALGPMSILSPLTALVSACVPLTVGLLRGEVLAALGYVGIALALVAVVLVGFVPERDAVRASGKALLMAVGSGLMIGAFLVLIDVTPNDSGLVPLIANRGVNVTVVFLAIGVLTIVARRRRRRGAAVAGMLALGWRGGFWLAIACGVLDATANALVLLGVRIGELSVVAVLIALYPAGTIILAALVLRERIAPVQAVGLVLALTAAAMLALA